VYYKNIIKNVSQSYTLELLLLVAYLSYETVITKRYEKKGVVREIQLKGYSLRFLKKFGFYPL